MVAYTNMIAYMNMMRAILGFQRSFLVVIHSLQPRLHAWSRDLLIEIGYKIQYTGSECRLDLEPKFFPVLLINLRTAMLAHLNLGSVI